jgi:hypothetical protein
MVVFVTAVCGGMIASLFTTDGSPCNNRVVVVVVIEMLMFSFGYLSCIHFSINLTPRNWSGDLFECFVSKEKRQVGAIVSSPLVSSRLVSNESLSVYSRYLAGIL